uniref:HMG box domain-containing protein n=1 Tax=Entomoneis paludosa TaxID=265537 RepID=A0A7S2Y3L5_9STRA
MPSIEALTFEPISVNEQMGQLFDDQFDRCVEEVLGKPEESDFSLNETKMQELLLSEKPLMNEPEMAMPTNVAVSSFKELPSVPQEVEEILEKPKRSLSAYNYFFQAERKKLLQSLPDRRQQGRKKPRNSHGKMGFAEMARNVSAKWKKITPEEKKEYDELAKLDTIRYRKEMAIWKRTQSNLEFAQQQVAASMNELRGFSSEPVMVTQAFFQQQQQQMMNWSGQSAVMPEPSMENNVFIAML